MHHTKHNITSEHPENPFWGFQLILPCCSLLTQSSRPGPYTKSGVSCAVASARLVVPQWPCRVPTSKQPAPVSAGRCGAPSSCSARPDTQPACSMAYPQAFFIKWGHRRAKKEDCNIPKPCPQEELVSCSCYTDHTLTLSGCSLETVLPLPKACTKPAQLLAVWAVYEPCSSERATQLLHSLLHTHC